MINIIKYKAEFILRGIQYFDSTQYVVDVSKVIEIEDVDLLIAHNVDFDFPVLNCEFIRSSLKTKFSDIETLCTMKSTTSLCNIPGKYGPKWPKLEELYNHLFNKNFQGAHRAINDVKACAECFIQLKK